MTIAKKHAQSYMPNGELSLEQVIQAAIDEAAKSHGPSPDPVKLAEHYEQRIRQLEAERVPALQYTTGHCANNAKPGGCQLHNLHCNYPACDRRPVAPQPKKGA